MPLKNINSTNIWLKRAKSNLVRAKMPKPNDVFWEDLCFDAQQCVEKSLKALLIFYKINFRYVHDIGELLQTLNKNDIKFPTSFKDAVILIGYSVEARCPVLSERRCG